MILLMKELFPASKEHFTAASIAGVLLYAINPLLIQHSMVLNADNNISAFAIILYVYLFCRFERSDKITFLQSRLILSLAVLFNFWAKEITPCFLMGAVVIYRLFNREFKKLLYDVVFNIMLGLALFWGTWYLYCRLSGTDVFAFIKFTVARKSPKILTMKFFANQLKMFWVIWKWPFYWVSAPFFILLFISMARRKLNYFLLKSLESVDFLCIASALMFLPFIFVKPSIDMMKYQYPCYPLFIAVMAHVIVKDFYAPVRFRDMKDNILLKLAAVFLFLIIGLSIWYFTMGDYIFNLWKPVSQKFLFMYYVPIIIMPLAMILIFNEFSIYRNMILSLFMMVFPISIALNLNQTASYTTAECWLNYGEAGLKDTVLYLREHVDPKRTVVVRKDIEYYLNYRYKMGLRYWETSSTLKMIDMKNFMDFLNKENIQYFVVDKVSAIQRLHPDIFKVVSMYFVQEAKFGDFLILRSRRNP